MNKLDLRDRVAIVTGGARGLGKATAKRMLDSGAKVALWDLNVNALESATNDLDVGERLLTISVDVSDEASVSKAFSRTLTHFGRVDILVNNAGIGGPNKPLWEVDLAGWQQTFDINVNGVFYCIRAAVPHMLARGTGRIVNVASVAGKEGNPNASAYSASKAAVIGLTKSVGKELAKTSITVNCVAPAAVNTDYMQSRTEAHKEYILSKIPMARFGREDEIAALISWLSSDDASFSTGATFDVSGGRATY
ncbi:SDR family NAD(P)-dependent oxidoreductase [Paraburkholderia sediminicola]|jgi:3-oxoacyl-[acyl-carrier protein] reductase|uniref:SDR family NAD(P)-dependent oxidoreductase n=1 Tax=Paraburkholderia sediminicola TaxID=458836 RepID=UPI0038BC3C20